MSPSGRTSRASCTPCTPTAIPGSSPRDTSPTDHLPDRPLRGAPIADRPPKCPSSAPAARRGAIGRQGAPHRCLGLCPHAQVRASAHSTGSGVTLDSRPPAVCPGGAAPCRAQRERRDRHRQSERRQTPLRGARWLLEASGLTSSSAPRRGKVPEVLARAERTVIGGVWRNPQRCRSGDLWLLRRATIPRATGPWPRAARNSSSRTPEPQPRTAGDPGPLEPRGPVTPLAAAPTGPRPQGRRHDGRADRHPAPASASPSPQHHRRRPHTPGHPAPRPPAAATAWTSYTPTSSTSRLSCDAVRNVTPDRGTCACPYARLGAARTQS